MANEACPYWPAADSLLRTAFPGYPRPWKRSNSPYSPETHRLIMISSLIDFGHLALAVFEFENDIIGQSVGVSEIVHAYIIKKSFSFEFKKYRCGNN